MLFRLFDDDDLCYFFLDTVFSIPFGIIESKSSLLFFLDFKFHYDKIIL